MAARRLVVLGASAGGLEALGRVFDLLPAHTGATFVVIQHLSADHPTMMDTLLSRRTSMGVRIAEQGSPLVPNEVLLIPPGRHMRLRGDHIELFERPQHGVGLPIDDFLISAAPVMGERLVVLILSGTGSDGSRGVVQVSEWGGVVLAQSPDSSEFDGMPRAAVATGVVDHCLPLEQLGPRLADILRRSWPGQVAEALPGGDAVLDQAEDVVQTLVSIAAVVRQYAGLDLDHYKPDMLLRRIRRRMQLLGDTSLLSYADRLVGNEAEAHQLRREVLIPVTRFFRDPETHLHLSEEVLPALIEAHPTEDPLRVWVCACATGEEAYSLAILLSEACAKVKRWPLIKVYATDVEQRFLDIASAGIYPESIQGEVSAERLQRHFIYKDHQYQVRPELRAMVVFARHNVLVDPPFTRLSLLSCRNLLIYLRPATQELVLRRLQFALKPEGLLILGRSESLLNVERDFIVSDSQARVFKLAVGARRRLPPVPALSSDAPARTPPGLRGDTAVNAQALQLLQHLSRRYAPAAVLIDEDRQVLHTSGDMATWLSWREGAPTLDLASLLPLELSSVVTHLLSQLADDKTVRTPPLALGERLVQVAATRLPPDLQQRRAVVVAFEPVVAEPLSAQPAELVQLAAPDHEMVGHLERELAATRARLHTTIEELQLTNEELQAANEELQASNEELQSTNEELQSVNEELYSVNSEYQAKVQQMGALNADLEGMAQAVGLPNLFVDEQLQVLRFTDEICGLFNLRPSDVGRCLTDFSHRLDAPELYADMRQALASGKMCHREVRGTDGRWFLIRLVPYMAATGSAQPGRRLVATFIDVSLMHDAARLQAIIDAMPANLAVLDRDANIVSVNRRWRQFAALNGDPELQATGIGRNYLTVMATACVSEPEGESRNRIDAAQKGLVAVLRGELPEFFQVYPCHSPDEARWFALHITPVAVNEGGALVAHYNVTGWIQPEASTPTLALTA
jgi:two-component system CheB/CheR fusion protein